MKKTRLTNRPISKNSYLYLLDELEKNTITEDQFYKLLNCNGSKAKFIVEIMKLDDLACKDDFFEELLALSDIQCEYDTAITLFNKYPIYKTDIEMRSFIINHQRFFEDEILNLLQHRFFFENKEFLNNLTPCCGYYPATKNVFKKISDYLEKEGKEEDNDRNLRLLNICVSIKEDRGIVGCLNYLKVRGLRKEPLWFEYLKDHYNYKNSLYDFTSAKDFQNLDELGRLDKITEKLYEIDKIKGKEKKTETFNNFFNNIRIIADVKEEEIFNHCLNYLTCDDENFDLRLSLKRIGEAKNWDDDTLNKYYLALLSLYDNVRRVVLNILRDNHSFLTLSLIQSLHEVWYDDAKKILLQEAIKQGDTAYVDKCKPPLDNGKLDSKFLLYLDICKPNREELIAMKEALKNAEPYYNGSEFVIGLEEYQVGQPEIVESKEKAGVPQKKKKFDFRFWKKNEDDQS